MYGKVWGRVTSSELEEGGGGHYLYLLPEKACSCSVTVNMSAHDLRRVSMYTRTIKEEEEEDDPWADISPFKVSLSLPANREFVSDYLGICCEMSSSF